jgi:hypothetical protein
MCPKKLSSSDKLEILNLYRNSPETTSTLANLYDVSSSTISRLLKKNLSDQEYDSLIHEKRLSRSNKTPEQLILSLDDSIDDEDITPNEFLSEETISQTIQAHSPISDSLELNFSQSSSLNFEIEENQEENQESNASKIRRRRKRSSSPVSDEIDPSTEEDMEESNPVIPEKEINSPEKIKEIPFLNQKKVIPPVTQINRDDEDDDDDDDETMTHETVLSLQEFLGEELEDIDEDFDDEDDDEDDDEEEYQKQTTFNPLKQGNLSIFPLENASFPKICYIVVDRCSELITRPLQDFRELGLIPPEEVTQKTLPVFENHRVARRFSKRKERVIKIPDGGLLKKTSPYLASKGITRLLLDGQVYSLSVQ